MKRAVAALCSFAFVAGIIVVAGCHKTTTPETTGPNPGPDTQPSGDANLKQIMMKIGKGPKGGLDRQVGTELAADPTPWDSLQPAAKEYADLAASMAKSPAPRGNGESWQQLTSAYSESAASLSRAAQAKDLTAAKAAHDKLAASCMPCHRAHRGGGGPRGG